MISVELSVTIDRVVRVGQFVTCPSRNEIQKKKKTYNPYNLGVSFDSKSIEVIDYPR